MSTSSPRGIRLFAFPALMLGAVLLLGAVLYWQLEAFQKNIQQETLASIQEATELFESLTAPLLREGRLQEVREICDDFTRDSLRLTVIRADGTVIADSTRHDADALENHRLREEVQGALNGAPVAVTRQSESTGKWMTYYATLLDTPADGPYILRAAVSTDRTSRILLLSRRLFWGTLALGVAAVALLTLHVWRRLYRPLERLQESMSLIADGALDTPIPVPSRGLVRKIAKNVRGMTGQLRKQLREMQRLEEFRKDFISNISHEIKTPLTAIITAVETLQEAPELPEEQQKRLLAMLCSQSQRLNNLVQDILALASLEHRQEERRGDFVPLDLREVAKSCLEEVRELADQKKCNLALVASREAWVLGDPQLLSQAIGNLLRNALKYSGSQSVTLVITQTDDAITLACVDHGCGIPKEHWPRIFERFYRVDKQRSRSQGGTGLGLAIVKHTLQLHQGSAEIDETPGGGSTFRIVLPKAKGEGSRE